MKEEIGNILGDIPCEVIYNSIDIDAQTVILKAIMKEETIYYTVDD